MANRLISASAGTGKTYQICEHVFKAVEAGLDPARLVATTFTRKAAGELKARLQRRLLGDKSLSPEKRRWTLDRLELAAIGTVHSVGHRFLMRFALDLGMAPRLDILEESVQEEGAAPGRHLERLLMQSPPKDWNAFDALSRRLEQDSIATVLRLIALKRGNAMSDKSFRSSMEESCTAWLKILLGDGKIVRFKDPMEAVKALADTARKAMEKLDDETKVTQSAISDLRGLASRGVSSWGELAKVAKLGAGIRSGADDLLGDLRSLGIGVNCLAGLHAELKQWMELATDMVIALEAGYRVYKTERGLVDYMDLETLFLELLRNKELDKKLRAEVELLVVDEFQDTNPLQLAVFRRLTDLSKNTVWVGDAKQSIFGFRGCDAGLVEGVWKSTRATKEHLKKNYRSQEGLVNILNEIFKPVYGEDAVVEAHRKATPRAIERWWLEDKKVDERAAACAAGIQTLIREGTFTPGDIAVLTRTNKGAERIAACLKAAGVAVVLPLPGLLSTLEGGLLYAGLRLSADRHDGIAAAEILHFTEERADGKTPKWYGDRLREMSREPAGDEKRGLPFANNELLKKCSEIRPEVLSPADWVLEVAAALDLPRRMAGWGDPERRAASLDAVVDLASDYEASSHQMSSAVTPAGFLRHLDELKRSGTDHTPLPRGLDAVQVLTCHRAKGLEWPAVVCFELDKIFAPGINEPMAHGGDHSAGDPLVGRALRFWPWPLGYDDNEWGHKLKDPLKLLPGIMSNHDVGRAAKKAEEEEALRLLYVAFTRARDCLILAHPRGACPWLDLLGRERLDKLLGAGEKAVAKGEETTHKNWKTSIVHRAFSVSDLKEGKAGSSKVRWFKNQTPKDIEVFPPRWHSPSGLLHDPVTPEIKTQDESLGGSLRLHSPRYERADHLGNALHAYYAALPALSGTDRKLQVKYAERGISAWKVADLTTGPELVDSGDRLVHWLRNRWPNAEILTEVPLEGPRVDGGRWRGNADILIRKGNDILALIDHKTTGGAKGNGSAVEVHIPQLLAYREALGSDKVSLWMHLPLSGTMVQVT